MEETTWKHCVPSSYWDTVTCHFVKENGNIAYVCIKEGAFIECCNGVIERSCLLTCYNADIIEQFFTYHPFMEYFIVKDEDKLTIISNTKDLNVFQKHIGIKKYEIGDYSAEGYPQIKIWPFDDQKQSFIADFSEASSMMGNASTSHNNDYISSRLQPKLKEAKDLLATYIKDLESKRKLRSESMQRLMNDNSTEDYLPPTEMQCFLGCKSDEKHSTTKLSKPGVQLLYPWQMAADKQWLLGIIVKNSSTRVISNFKVFLHEIQKGRISYTVKRLNSKNISEIFNRLESQFPALPPKPIVVWHEEALEDKLSPGEGCILISTFPFPDFTTTSIISILGQLSYSVANHENKTEQVCYQEFPQFKITARNVLNASLITNSPHKSFFEFISTLAVSEAVVFTIQRGMASTKPIEIILTEDIGFSPIHEDNLFSHPGENNHALSGCVIQKVDISKRVFEMRLYARNHELLVLLVYSILEALPGSWDVKYSGTKSTVFDDNRTTAVTVDHCSEALFKEITFIVSNLTNWKRKHTDNKICIDVNLYSKFRKVLSSLQKQTDQVFSCRDLETN